MIEESLWFVEIRRLKKVDQSTSYSSQFTRLIACSHWLGILHTTATQTNVLSDKFT